jgi:acyl carrier protein
LIFHNPLFPLDETGASIAASRRMESSDNSSPTPTELIDWLSHEGIVDLEWDFPEDGDLVAAGLDSMAVMRLVVAMEEEYGIVLDPEDLTRAHLASPKSLAALIRERMS